MNSKEDVAQKYKMAIRLELLYKHCVKPADWPLRICVSLSGNVVNSDRESDFLLEKTDNVDGKTSNDFLEKTRAVDSEGSTCFCLNLMLCSKYQKKKEENHAIFRNTTIIVSVFCSTVNELGRRCWRNGGSCHFLLVELSANVDVVSEGWKPYIVRKVVNNAYNVKPTDRLTGLMGARLGMTDESNFDRFSKKRCWVPCFLLSRPKPQVKCWKYHSCDDENDHIAPSAIISENPLALFVDKYNQNKLNLKVSDAENKLNLKKFSFSNVLSPSNTSNKTSKLAKGGGGFFERNVYESKMRYERLLKRQEKIVLDRDKRSEKMKCPWTPMDVCLSKFMSDYKTEQLLLENPLETQLGSRFFQNQEFIGGEELNSENQQKPRNTSQDDADNMTLFDSEIVCVTSLISIDKNNGNKEHDDRALTPRNSHNNISKFSNPIQPEAEYLPFFAFMIHPRLRASKHFWHTSLSIMIERQMMSEERYIGEFFRMSPSEKAAEAFQMICNYSQCLEYVSDFYTTMTLSTSGGKPKRRKRCVEQFSNCLRNWGGDCEDLSQGHYQLYTLFTRESEKDFKHDAAINSHPVLKEMRRILRHNYVIFLTIEGVYLPKQSFEDGENSPCEDRSDDKRTDGDKERPVKFPNRYLDAKTSQETYLKETKNLNSAHAAVKLLPKEYFEDCVNRSSFGHANGPIFCSRSETDRQVGSTCCFYHKYPPDPCNRELPVLFGEGTSMLVCLDGARDPLKEKWMRSCLMSDDELADRLKSPIYCKNGQSSFYRSTLFGSCDSFMNSKNVATYSFARLCVERPRGKRVGETESKVPVFLRGVSHKQLTCKSDAVALVPYGHDNNNNNNNLERNVETSNEISNVCQNKVFFSGREFEDEMLTTCKKECANRMPGRKITSVMKCEKKSLGSPICKNYKENKLYYEPFRDDSKGYLDVEEMKKKMTTILRSLHVGGRNARFSKNGQYFHIFFDNAYASEKLCQKIVDVFKKDTIRKYAKTRERHDVTTSLVLEKMSGDLWIWRLTFELGRWEF